MLVLHPWSGAVEVKWWQLVTVTKIRTALILLSFLGWTGTDTWCFCGTCLCNHIHLLVLLELPHWVFKWTGMDDTQVLLLVRLSFLLLYICFKKKAEFGQLHQVNFGGWEQHERSTYNILVKQLGEEDSRTRESANWIKTFQIRENQVSTQLCEVLLEFYSCMRSVCL